MDIKTAIEYLKDPIGKPLEWHDKAINLAIEALKKQIPKRPKADNNGNYAEYFEEWIECPKCGEAVPEYTSEKETECYCLGCGQKLSWD